MLERENQIGFMKDITWGHFLKFMLMEILMKTIICSNLLITDSLGGRNFHMQVP